MFVDFYQTFSHNAMWSANEVMQVYRNIKSTKISCCLSIDKIIFFTILYAITTGLKLEKKGGHKISVRGWGRGRDSLSWKINANPGKLEN